MSFHIGRFSAQLGKNSVSKASHFDVTFSLPNKLGFSFFGNGPSGVLDSINSAQNLLKASELTLRANAVELPGRTVQSTAFRSYGVERQFGYTALYEPISITFLLSEDLRERDLFLEWQDTILGNHRKKNVAEFTDFDVGYYDDYVADIVIKKYSETNKVTNRVTLVEAYPKSINSISMAHSSDELMSCTIQFQYRYYKEISAFNDALNVAEDLGVDRNLTGLLGDINNLL